MHTATLCCGTVLHYESRSFVPALGERVPCRRHGYCDVDRHGVGTHNRSRRPRPRRAQPRARDELLTWLGNRPVTTLHTLRRHRFTLRMVAAAERDGLIAVDLETGRVDIR
jgi:hypothetical protein